MAASDFPHVAAAEKYARAVVAGRILASQWVRFACSRHLDDLAKSKAKGPAGTKYPYRFDAAQAERVCKFVEALPHTKGAWASRGERFVMQPWQCFITVAIFGWLRKSDGLRRFRRVFLLIPRKNGKSQWAAAIALYMTVADREYGAEVYSGATTERQAWEVFRPARLMALRTPALCKFFGVEVTASNVSVLKNGSRLEPMIGNPGDGSSPSCAIHDEYHEHDTDAQVDTMATGMGAREQPLQIIITTAGFNVAGPCYAAQLEAQKVLSGVMENDQLFACIWCIDPGDDWTKPEALRKANPNIDVSVSMEFLRTRQLEAIQSARKQGTFQTKHLNLWVSARSAYFNVQSWRQCAAPGLSIEQYVGRRCFIGLDLATKVDLAAMTAFFPDFNDRGEITGGAMFWWYFAPEATVELPENEHYRGWEQDEYLIVNPGAATDFDAVREELSWLRSECQVEAIAYDPNQATYFAQQLLNDEGAPMVEYRQSTPNMSEPMKLLDAMIRSETLQHPGDPVSEWCISNVVSRPNAKEEEYPRKERAENKIDGAVSAIMAVGIAQSGGVVKRSVYETRGLVTV